MTAADLWERAQRVAEVLAGTEAQVTLAVDAPEDTVHRWATLAQVQVEEAMWLGRREAPYVLFVARWLPGGMTVTLQGCRPATAADAHRSARVYPSGALASPDEVRAALGLTVVSVEVPTPYVIGEVP